MVSPASGAPQRAPSEYDRLREYAQRLAEQAPALTAEQRCRIAALLRTPTARPDVTGGAA